MKSLNNLAPYLGILAPIVAFSFIAAAILTHPWFSFQHNALSDLGNPDVELHWIFNVGLIIAGILGVIFSVDLVGRVQGLRRLAAIIFIVSTAFLSMIGFFPEGTKLHFPSAVAFYLLAAIAILIYAAAWFRAGEILYGVLALVLLAIGFGVALIPEWDGIAIPETVGAAIIFVWLYLVIWQVYFPDAL